jgi:hypothetical protein
MSSIIFHELFYCFDCNTTRHYRDCARRNCEEWCSTYHLCECGDMLAVPMLTTKQQEDLIQCSATSCCENDLYLALQKLEWMNHSTYILAACDRVIHSEGFPQNEKLISLFANWYEFQAASLHVVTQEDLSFLTNCLNCLENCSDKMRKVIILQKLFQYLMDHPAILYRSKQFRTIAQEKAIESYVFAGCQKQAITAAAEEEGAIMEHDKYEAASELQNIIWIFFDLPILN